MVIHSGSCHCGAIRFEVEASEHINVTECNCSICYKSGYMALIVPAERFRLLRGKDAISEYRFNTGVAKHTFCSICGIKAFYTPRSHPDGISVNVRCLDPATIAGISSSVFDGQHWEEQLPAGRADSFPN